MKKNIFALVALIILTFTIVTCTTNPNPSSSSASSQTASPTEEVQPSVSSEPGSPASPSASQNNGNPTVSSPSPNSNQESQDPNEKCSFQFSLLFDATDVDKLELTCAVTYVDNPSDFKEKGWQVFLTQGGKEKKELDVDKPTVLLEDSTLETKEAIVNLLFDTFDLVKASETFKFSAPLKRDDLNIGTPGIKGHYDFQLDIGSILVANVRPIPLKAIGAERASSSVNKDGSQNSSLVSRLWQWGADGLKSLSLVLFQNGLFVQKALAIEVNNERTLGEPALTTKTAEAKIESNLAVYVVNRDASRKKTQVFSLTDQPIRVTDQSGRAVELRRNQTIVATEAGFVGDQYEYRLCRFYKNNSDLLEGLAPDEVDIVMQKSLPLQMSYHAARSLMMSLYNRNCRRPCPQPGS